MEELHQKRIFDSFNFLVNTARITPKKTFLIRLILLFIHTIPCMNLNEWVVADFFSLAEISWKKKFSPDKLGTSQRNRSA